MAQEIENKKSLQDFQCIIFNLGEEEFALDILQVREIIRVSDITRVPGSPDFIEGILNLRGRVIPVINLHQRFGFPATPASPKNRIIVLETGNEFIGVRVDSVRKVIFLKPDTIKESPEVLTTLDTQYIAGIAHHDGHLIILIDSQSILNAEQIETVKDLGHSER